MHYSTYFNLDCRNLSMVFELRNKVVLITGGSTGIGAKIIEYLLEENVKHVTNLDILEDKGVNLQNELNKKYGESKVKFQKGDVTNEEQLFGAYQSIIDEYGYIDIVINNAGILNDSKEKYKKEIEINLTAVITSTLKAMEVMRKDEGGKGGVVINMSSTVALFQDSFAPIYFSTKSAVLQFSNCIGLPEYYTRTGVRVLTICFGGTDTLLLTRKNLGNFDQKVNEGMMDLINVHYKQKAESAATAVIEALKRGKSGSTWLSLLDKPVQDITATVKKAYGILGELANDKK